VTTERKPYCIEHLDRLPYVRELQAQLFSRDAEEEAAATRKGWRAVDPAGSRAREIIDQLAVKGAQTPKRLAITVELRPTSLENYLGALERAGFVKTLTLGSRRGTPRRVVTLTDEGKTQAVNVEEPITEENGEAAEAA
jgi:predicted ArsR family transcriptional regulator